MANRLDELKRLLKIEETAAIPSQRYIEDLKLSIADLERFVPAPIKVINTKPDEFFRI